MARFRNAWGWVIMGLVLAAAGCAQTASGPQTQPALQATATPPVADIPVPVDFQMEAQSSARVIPGSNLRFVDHYYKGDADLLAVVRFYREHMPDDGWKLAKQEQMPGDQFTLSYTKAHEDAIITVYPGTFDTHVRAQVQPSARNGAQ